MKQYFVHTSDEETALRLRELGFQELPKEGNRWVFLNDPERFQFAENDMKVNFTNKLTF